MDNNGSGIKTRTYFLNLGRLVAKKIKIWTIQSMILEMVSGLSVQVKVLVVSPLLVTVAPSKEDEVRLMAAIG